MNKEDIYYISPLLEYWLFNLSNMDKMNTTMPFITKSAGLSRLNELGRFHAMSQIFVTPGIM